MKAPEPRWIVARSIATWLLQLAIGPLARRTALFFLLFLAVLSALYFGAGFPFRLLWKLACPLFILSVALAFRTLLKGQSAPIQGPQVYDKAKYHYDGDFPKGLPRRQAFVHTGMFVGWLVEHEMIAEGFLPETEGFQERKITGAGVYKAWDGCLTSDALTDHGNRFASDYFDFEHGQYLDDYVEVLAKDLPSMYHVADTWENYELIKKKIDQRYEAWKKNQK